MPITPPSAVRLMCVYVGTNCSVNAYDQPRRFNARAAVLCPLALALLQWARNICVLLFEDTSC